LNQKLFTISGNYYGGVVSSKRETRLICERRKVVLEGIMDDPVRASRLVISSRIGNTPRYIRFPDGSQFETADNDTVDRMIRACGLTRKSMFIHTLESKKRVILTTFLVVVIFVWAQVRYALPALSRQIAFAIPDELAFQFGDEVFDAMDKNFFQTSKLSARKKKKLTALFRKLEKKLKNPPRMELLFRRSEAIGANAFALPDGRIVMTDDLVKLSSNRMEIGAVMLHEMGHVVNRHSLRLAVQNFGLGMLILVFTGDVSTSSSVITAIPVILVQSGYSQDMEREADNFALDYFKTNRIKPEYFASILSKLQRSHSEKVCEESQKDDPDAKESCETIEDDSDSYLDYLSTHPAMKERIANIRGEKTEERCGWYCFWK